MLVKIPVSVGELFDKITILEIKLKYADEIKSVNIKKELNLLNKKASKIKINVEHINKLKKINYRIWNIEDTIRTLEGRKDFNVEFIETARMIYTLNDERAVIKKTINLEAGSKIIEEKIY